MPIVRVLFIDKVAPTETAAFLEDEEREVKYPEGIDCVWLASDREGHVGAFITAGMGPIPAEALNSTIVPFEDIGGRLDQLPRVSEARLLVPLKRPDDFIDLAERGLFVYDWSDIHRTARGALQVYEAMAVPTQPITVSSLPSDLSSLATALSLAAVLFAAGGTVDIRAPLSCIETEI